jgi:hypothetical protein
MKNLSKRIAHIRLTKNLLDEFIENLGDGRASGKTQDYVWFELLGSESHEDFEKFFQSFPPKDGISTANIMDVTEEVEKRVIKSILINFQTDKGELTPIKDIFSMLRDFPKFQSIIERKKISKRSEKRMEEKLPSREEQIFKGAM